MSTWQSQASQKRSSLLSSIPPEWRLPSIPTADQQSDVTGTYTHQYLTASEIEITESTATEILSNTTTGKWSSVSVIKAFSHRAAIAHQLTSCLHEIFFEEGIASAGELDAYFKAHGKPVGALHGLPISLKDSVNIKGIDTTNGFIADIGQPAEKDAELCRILREMGAVLYCKTSVPQASFAAETENNIIGYTLSAQNRLLSSGGSSGGEGPLMALRGSVLGLASDIGGSIRHPAALNGIYALKPSCARLPIEGVSRVMEGQDAVPFSWGPVSLSVDGLTLLLKAILGREPWLADPRVVPLAWREGVFGEFKKRVKMRGGGEGKLVFGVMRDDGVVRPQPPIQRGVEMLVDKVRKLGHEVVEWDPPSHNEATELILKTWSFDGSEDVLNNLALSGEPIVPSVAQIFGTQPRKQFTATEIADTNIAIWSYRKRYMDYWNSTKDITSTGRPVDAVIVPTFAYAGVIPGKLKYAGYTPFANVLDYSVGVMPVTAADKNVDVYPADFSPLSEMDRTVKEDYDAELQHGSPVGISIFGRRYEEEKILGILEGLSSG